MGPTSHLFCRHCGAANPVHARFCSVCGYGLSEEEDTAKRSNANNGGIPATPPLTVQFDPALEPSVPSLPELKTPALTQNISQTASITISDVHIKTPQLSPALSKEPADILKQRYRIIKKIGSGGYGEVYKAADTQFGDRHVAVKEMSQRGLSAPEINEASEAFKHEAFLLAALTHPGLPSIYDYFCENERWYLVMSFIEGETLETYLNRSRGNRIPAEKALHIGTQLAAVLSHLHTRKPPIIFRDLKPSNIMRTYDGQIYLIDFGIARHFKPGKIKDTMALGSPGYAAPEQYGRAQTTPQADVYSLGVTMHQMISGLDPSLSPFNLPPLHIPEYPQLSILITCMLEMDIKKRPASMGNIKRELQRIATGRSPMPTNQHPAQKAPKPLLLPSCRYREGRPSSH